MEGRLSNADPTRVLIVDDHPAVREGLAIRVTRQPDLEVCSEAGDLPTALQAIEAHHPQVVVIDVALADDNGIDLIRRIRCRNTSIRILVWSMYPESLYAERALRAGANGYITKGQATSRIIEAIRTVRDGKLFLSEEAASSLLQKSMDGSKTGHSPGEVLSDRELEVFDLIGEGLKTAEIADRLHVSIHTVETHRQRIRTKLSLRSGADLARAAAQWALEKS